MITGSAHKFLLEILTPGSLKIDAVTLKLARSGKLGFGVEPMNIVSAAIQSGDVVALSDGGKTYLRIPAPFVALERVYPKDDGQLEYRSARVRHEIKPAAVEQSYFARVSLFMKIELTTALHIKGDA